MAESGTAAGEATEVLTSIGQNIEIWRVKVDDIKEQDKNARSQSPDIFNRLKSTMERDHRLESLPFCASTGGSVEIISGHHRVRAARMAGLKDIAVMVDVSGLSRSQIVAKQLAHNALSGKDDDGILAQLFQEIDSIDGRLESGLDPVILDMLNMDPVSLQGVSVDFSTRLITFAFLPTQLEDFDTLAARVGKVDTVGAIDIETFDEFRDAVERVGKVEDIRSIGAIVSRMVDAAHDAMDAIDELEDEEREHHVAE